MAKPRNPLKTAILKICDSYLGKDYLLFVFGSWARGNIDRTSDIDLAIYRTKFIPSKIINDIKEDLENKTPALRSFDLVNLTSPHVSRDLLKNILSEGVLWRKPKSFRGLLKNLKKRLTSTKK